MKRHNTRLEMQELLRLESSPKGTQIGAELVALPRACGTAKEQGEFAP